MVSVPQFLFLQLILNHVLLLHTTCMEGIIEKDVDEQYTEPPNNSPLPETASSECEQYPVHYG